MYYLNKCKVTHIDVNLPASANNFGRVTKTILIFVYHSIIGPVHVEVNKKIITSIIYRKFC